MNKTQHKILLAVVAVLIGSLGGVCGAHQLSREDKEDIPTVGISFVSPSDHEIPTALNRDGRVTQELRLLVDALEQDQQVTGEFLYEYTQNSAFLPMHLVKQYACRR